MSVLVVDDDAELRLMMEFALADAGYTVWTAPDGQAALTMLTAPASPPPCLILLDMRMPRMDGWQFARAFRARDPGHTPIVVVTAAAEGSRRAADIGAQGHLDKPFDIDDLLRMVARHCSPDD
jgi:CheY-like chemotaxis protein